MANRYAPLGEYGVIGDLHTVALVGGDGSIDFLCLPHFDSPSVFAALVDAERGGRFQIADMIRDESTPQCERVTNGSWANCVGGTVTVSCFIRMLAEIGFVRAACIKTTGYRTSASTIGAFFFAQKPSK